MAKATRHGGGVKPTPVLDRMLAKIDRQPDGCWIWTASTNRLGYGQVCVGLGADKAMRLAHRVMWTELVGPIAEGLELDHLCRKPACVNPQHLEPVTHAENLRRGNKSGPKPRDYCGRGHSLAEFGAYRSYVRKGWSTPERYCRECRRLDARRRRREGKG